MEREIPHKMCNAHAPDTVWPSYPIPEMGPPWQHHPQMPLGGLADQMGLTPMKAHTKNGRNEYQEKCLSLDIAVMPPWSVRELPSASTQSGQEAPVALHRLVPVMWYVK